MTKKIFLLCGIPGSGKSYWTHNTAEQLDGEAQIVSRDAIRFSLLKDGEDYFKRENAVFAQFVKTINDCIANGVPYIFIDATHISRASRAKVLSRLRASTPIALSVEVFNTPVATCIERNAQREGLAKVPNQAIYSMAKQFQEPCIEEFEWSTISKVEIHHHNQEGVSDNGLVYQRLALRS